MSASFSLLFSFAAALALASALGTILARRPLRGAMFLLAHLGSLALLYLTLSAQFLAAIQILVYAVAILVLFVFVIMMIGPGLDGPATYKAAGAKTLSVVLILSLALSMAAILGRVELPMGELPEGFGGVRAIGLALYRGATVPFELIAMVLTVAVLGVLGIARKKTAVELAREGAAPTEGESEQADQQADQQEAQTQAGS